MLKRDWLARLFIKYKLLKNIGYKYYSSEFISKNAGLTIFSELFIISYIWYYFYFSRLFF